ncbi:SCO3242 family prenyltransferase [Streptomyces sp. NPDC004435]|uniref:SCO3242 family prenyltransferase n=1 Tax=Streptomyces sp. NPDC004435 TaxID=3364701 RepID=UPI00367C4C02
MTGAPRPRPGTLRAWAELLRVSALPSVPGDALAGAAAAGLRPGGGTAWAVGASVCLYEAGMALNDWADRHVDAVERPRRPLPSGRVAPAAALGAAGALTATGLALASRAGRPALAVASALAATVWAYDLRLKHTAAGPAAMAAARGLDVLLGALATASAARVRESRPAVPGPTAGGGRAGIDVLAAAAPAAAAVAAHTYAVTAVSRHEADGGSTAAPAGALASSVLLALLTAGSGPHPFGSGPRLLGPGPHAPGSGPYPVGSGPHLPGSGLRLLGPGPHAPGSGPYPVGSGLYPPGSRPHPPGSGPHPPGSEPYPPGAGRRTRRRTDSRGRPGTARRLRGAIPAPGAAPPTLGGVPAAVHRRRIASDRVAVFMAGAYLRTVAGPLLHAVLNPSPHLTQRAVGGGVRAVIPLQAVLAARSGSPVVGMALLGLAPVARRLARKVSPT